MKMDLDRFTKIVQSYGSVPVRWPEDERELAKQFLANSSEAKAILAIEEPLDDLLMLAERKLVTHDSMETLRESVLIENCDSIPWIKDSLTGLNPTEEILALTLAPNSPLP